MSISSKDAVGLALAAGTVVLLLMHGGDRHDPAPAAVSAPEAPGAPAEGPDTDGDFPPRPEVVAFINVHLPQGPGDVRSTHVVLVRDGVVSEIGPTGSLDLPEDAFVVDCGGSGYLVASANQRKSADGWQPVVPGSADDLVLLAADPRLPSSGPDAIRGRLVDGLWTPDPSADPRRPADLSAGH